MRPLLLALLAGCTAPLSDRIVERPPCWVQREGMTVHASSAEAADRMVGVYAELDRQVRELLEVDGAPPELWLLEKDPAPTWDGGTDLEKGIIGLTRGWHDSKGLIAHELTHWYVQRWPAKLPILVEEGLGDLVAGTILGTMVQAHAAYAGRTAGRGWLSISLSEFLEIEDPEWKMNLRALGFQVAEREGIEALRAMCRQASLEGLDQVPPDRFQR